jgi:hypothetical protein
MGHTTEVEGAAQPKDANGTQENSTYEGVAIERCKELLGWCFGIQRIDCRMDDRHEQNEARKAYAEGDQPTTCTRVCGNPLIGHRFSSCGLTDGR